MPESKSEKQQLASSLSSVDSNSESSCLSKDYSNNQFINSNADLFYSLYYFVAF